MKTIPAWFLIILISIGLTIGSCEQRQVTILPLPVIEHPIIDRESLIPSHAVKMTPELDQHPPILHSDLFEPPIPLPYPVNTAGLEDAPFILPDGNTLYFFYTPNAAMDYHAQLTDLVSGIYVTHRHEDGWTVPERVWLHEPGTLALDGCPAVADDVLWFCSAREGYTGVNMFTAKSMDDQWEHITYVGDTLMHTYMLGEVHPHGDDLYFHTQYPTGEGSLNIWMTSYKDGNWLEPISIDAVNTDANESLPFITYDGKELWFTRTYQGTPALFRSMKSIDGWQSPELIMSSFAGEPTLDSEGNLYFTHHYFEDGIMIEADIYVAKRKPNTYTSSCTHITLSTEAMIERNHLLKKWFL